MKCGFAKMSTKGTFEPVWPYGTDIYGRFLYLESGKERVLIAAFDDARRIYLLVKLGAP